MSSKPSDKKQAPAPPPFQKQMSSRLLNMKFMQKAALSPQTSSPSSSSPPQPQKQQQRPSATNTDILAVQNALKQEEAKREEALRRREEELGEGRWELAFLQPPASERAANGIRVKMVGYADLGRVGLGNSNESSEEDEDEEGEQDDEDDCEDDEDIDKGTRWIHTGRLTFGNFKSRSRSYNDNDSNENGNREEADIGGEQGIPTTPSKPIQLKKLTSISGGGGAAGGQSKANMECFSCGKKGHAKADCPYSRRQNNAGVKRQWNFRDSRSREDGIKRARISLGNR